MTVLFAVLGALFLGFAGGFVTYQRSRRWCPVHGTSLVCDLCRAGHVA